MAELSLRKYQQEDVDFIVRRHRVLLANEPGLGKTAEALCALHKLGVSDTLIVGPNVSLSVWKDEAKKWLNAEALIYTGKPHQRAKIWEQFLRERPPFLIVNYALVGEVAERKNAWQAVVCDEIHLGGLLNHRTKTYRIVEKLRSRYMIPITGTPVRRGPQDLYAPLHLIDPYRFRSYWGFVNEHCIVTKDFFGYVIEPRPKDVRKFNAMLRQYMIRRTKKEVLPDLPPKVRQPIKLQLEGEQERMYRQLCRDMMLELSDGGVVVTPNVATLLLRLRQLLVTPRILGGQSYGVGIEALLDLIEAEFDSRRPVVVCTPFREAIPFIQEAIESRLTKHVYVIHGKIKEDPVVVASRFQNDSDPRKALIYTIKSGASFTAHTASTAFFLGYEWSAIDNLQAEDRLHRLGQHGSVNIYYLVYENTVDEEVMDKLDEKQMASNWILSPEMMLARLKKNLI